VVLAEEVNPAIRGYAAAVYSLFLSMGTGFGLLLSPLGDTGGDGWRLLFGLGSLPLLVFPVLAVRLKESRAYRPVERRPSLAGVLRSGLAGYFWPMAGISFAVSAFSAPAANFILPRMVNDLGWDQGDASLMLVLTSTPAVVLGLLAGGRAADILGRRPTEVGAMFVGASGGMAFYLFPNGWVMGCAIFLSILGTSAFAPAFAAQRAELFPTAVRATTTAWLVNAAIFGGLGGFLAGRFVVDTIGLAGMMCMLGGIVLSASGLVALLPETKGADLIGPEADPAAPPAATPG
jgi:MFS family permease